MSFQVYMTFNLGKRNEGVSKHLICYHKCMHRIYMVAYFLAWEMCQGLIKIGICGVSLAKNNDGFVNKHSGDVYSCF